MILNLYSFINKFCQKYQLIQVMGLQRFNQCDASHQQSFQYCCLQSNSLFCKKCWDSSNHGFKCQSSRCGDFSKLVDTILNRVLELKSTYFCNSLSNQNYQTFEKHRQLLVKTNFLITQSVKQYVEQKLPLFIWGMFNYLFQYQIFGVQTAGKTPNKNISEKLFSQTQKNINKFDAICNKLLKMSNGKTNSSKTECLQTAIVSFYQIDHELNGYKKDIKDRFSKNEEKQQQKPDISPNSTQKLNAILKHLQNHTSTVVKSLKSHIKNHFQSEVKNVLTSFSTEIDYKGVMFDSKYGSFVMKQQFDHQTILTDLYSKIQNYEIEVYRGFHLDIEQLEKYPQQILQLGKTFMKEKLFQVYDNIAFSRKSMYPYKIAYMISTSIQGNQIYDKTIINLEKHFIKTYDKAMERPFFNSTSIAVIGFQLIIINFHIHPELSYSIKIYGYQKQRQPYYDNVIEILGLKTIHQSKKEQYVQFNRQSMTKLQLAYCNLRIAYEMIFMNEKEEYIFEGQAIASARGAQFFKNLITNWRKYAKIDLKFGQNMQNYISLAL